MPDLLPGSATRTWLDHLKDEYDYHRAEAERLRKALAKPGADHHLLTLQIRERDDSALLVLKLITGPFKGVEGHAEGQPVPTINQWLRSRGLAGLTVYCSYCHRPVNGGCHCYGPARGVEPAKIKTVADQFPGCYGEGR